MLVLTDHFSLTAGSRPTAVCTINITGLLTLLFYAIRALQSMDTGGFFNTGESESKLLHAAYSCRCSGGGEEAMMMIVRQTQRDVRSS